MWDRGLADELEWWASWITTEDGLRWRRDILDIDRPIQDHLIAECLRTLPNRSVAILELGPGPATGIGYSYPEKEICITPVDALAHEYRQLLGRAGICPPVQTVFGHGENLTSMFERNQFDIAYACNAVDHAYDPIFVIENLIQVTRSGGFVILRHYINEGEHPHGLHQWNFNMSGQDSILWDQNAEYNINRMFSKSCNVHCSYEKNPDNYGDWFSKGWKDWVICVLRKR